MPPSFPHAVFTPKDCLAVGSQFYTAGHIGHSLEGLKLQEEYPDISDEELHESIYRTVAKILRGCSVITTSVQKAEIITSCSLFPGPPHTQRTNKDLLDALESLGGYQETGYLNFSPKYHLEKSFLEQSSHAAENLLGPACELNVSCKIFFFKFAW
jgi:hypothetical protein